MNRVHLTEKELDKWWEYYERVGSPGPYHRPDYLELLAGEFEYECESAELFVLENGKEAVYYPYIRRSLNSVPYVDDQESDFSDYDDIVSSWYYGGPVSSEPSNKDLSERFKKEFSNFCSDEKIVAEFIRFDPNIENHEGFTCLDPQFNRETVWVDLSQTKDEIWGGFKSNNRTHIRQALETDIEIEITTNVEDYKGFYEIYCNAMEAKDASQHYRFPFDYFRTLLDETPDIASLVIARYEDEIIGGSLAIHDGGTAHEYLRASNPDYWDMRVNNLLCYNLILYMKEMGHDVLDFQGGRPGVFKFKRGFSPDRGEFYIGKRVHIQNKYDEMVELAEENSIETDTGYFPEYRIEKSN